MKKLTSLLLALTILYSLSISAFAAHTTTVSYTGTSGESYTLTVPATLTPGASGEVKANGTWSSNRTLVVTAPTSVTLTNSIDGGTKTLDVTFGGINQAGNDSISQTVTKTISVSNISNALFGTWTGTITYNVSMEDNGVPTPAPSTFTVGVMNPDLGNIVEDTITVENGMTWEEWINSEYNDGSYYIDGNNVKNDNYLSKPPIPPTYKKIDITDIISSSLEYFIAYNYIYYE